MATSQEQPMRPRFTPTVSQLQSLAPASSLRIEDAPRSRSERLTSPRPDRNPRTVRRALAATGAVGPLVFGAVTVLAGIVKPGYEIHEQTVSDLAVGAHGWLQTANFFALGVAIAAFALALGLRRRPGLRSPTAVALLVAAAAGVFTAGFFPTDLAGAPQTSHGVIHNTLFLGIFLALITAYAMQGRTLRRAGAEPGLARYSTLTAAAVFSLLVVFVMFAGDIGDPLHSVAGLLERLLIGAALAWITVTSRRLLAETN
jgi:hypothetical membrane protein